MIKPLVTVGIRKTIILPARWAKKFSSSKIEIRETREGILITAVSEKIQFSEKVRSLKEK